MCISSFASICTLLMSRHCSIWMCMYACVRMCACIRYTSICMCMYVYIYIYIHTYIHLYAHLLVISGEQAVETCLCIYVNFLRHAYVSMSTFSDMLMYLCPLSQTCLCICVNFLENLAYTCTYVHAWLKAVCV
jgi:hypothetical protein